MKIAGISGTILGAKTAVLVNSVLQEIKKHDSSFDTQLIELKDYNMQFCDGRAIHEYNNDTQKVINAITEADCFLIGTPIFNGSIPAPLKNLFDIVPPHVFRHKVMGFVANGGTYQHYLVVENQLKPIAGYFRSFVAPSFVYATPQHFNAQNELVDPDVRNRIKLLARELVYMQNGFIQLQSVELNT
jgi:FAD reductase [NAD(P)H]